MLYIVGTPIGNLYDLSLRQAQTLLSSDVIVTEDTRSTGMLMEKIRGLFPHLDTGHKPRLISYYKDNEFERLPEVLEIIKSGATVSLTSQAGMPLISDPGFLLITQLVKDGHPFTVIPGPTAALHALVASGFNPSTHMFVGFLPKKPNDLRKVIEKMKKHSDLEKDLAFIAYESPNRINKTLEILEEVAASAHIVIGRELTKKFEEIIRGTPSELKGREYRGEITVLIRL